jgi:hypothetical protein
MGLTEEIAIKLGIKAGDLKSVLSDAGATIKQFKKEGEGGDDEGFPKHLHSIKKGLRDVKELIVAGGIATAVFEFFNKAIELAKKTEGTLDEDASALIRLGGTFDKVKEIGQAALVTLAGWFTRFGEGIGKFAGMLVYGKEAVADSEKLAAQETQNLLLKERQKENAEKIKAISEQILEQAKRHNEITTKQLSDVDKIAKLEQAVMQAAFVLGNAGNDELKRQTALLGVKKAQNDLLEAQVEIAKRAKEEAAKRDAEDRKAAQDSLDLSRLNMTLQEQKKSLLAEQQALMITMNFLDEKSAEWQQFRVRLLEVQKKLQDENNTELKNGKEIATLLLKGQENLSDVEKEQLKLLKGQTSEKKQQDEIALYLKKGVENLTEAEKARLQVLVGQTAEIKTQGDEEEKQRKAFDAWSSKSITQKGDVRNLGDAQLDQLIQNLNKQIAPIKQADDMVAGIGGQLGTYKSIEQRLLEQNLEQAMKEQRDRLNFRQTKSFFGDDYAQRNYAPDEYSRLSQLINPDQNKKDSNNIAVVATGLSKLFPEKFDGAIR